MICWDFRHDCRKHRLANPDNGYRMCAATDFTGLEAQHLLLLSHILLMITLKLYSVEIVGTISFSVMTSMLEVQH